MKGRMGCGYSPCLRRGKNQQRARGGDMTRELMVMAVRILGAMLIGGLIGLERSFHGRPAGFRTHSLVCIASALLMLVTVYQNQWMTETPLDAIRTDPTRMAQG